MQRVRRKVLLKTNGSSLELGFKRVRVICPLEYVYWLKFSTVVSCQGNNTLAIARPSGLRFVNIVGNFCTFPLLSVTDKLTFGLVMALSP